MQVFSNIVNDSTSNWIKRCVIGDMLLGLGLSGSSLTLCLNTAKLAIGELQEASALLRFLIIYNICTNISSKSQLWSVKSPST